jgi:hypothetical protein
LPPTVQNSNYPRAENRTGVAASIADVSNVQSYSIHAALTPAANNTTVANRITSHQSQ